MAVSNKMDSIHPSQLSVRRQRIERWANKGRNISIDDKPVRITACLGSSSLQKQSESSISQDDRRLNTHLFRLGEEREKLIEQHNSDQKLFANKQAIRHKDNQTIQSTLNYVRKCCKYSHIYDNDEELINPSLLFEENRTTKTPRSRVLTATTSTTKRNLSSHTFTRSGNSLTEIFLKHNKKHIEQSRKPNENQSRHVQFQPNKKRNIESVSVSNRNPTLQSSRSITSTDIFQSTTFLTECDQPEEEPKPKRSPSRIFSSKKALQEFRHYPERFLSPSNRYLPLLHHEARKLKSREFSRKHSVQSSLLDSSEFVCDDATSFLSESVETGKSTVHSHFPTWDHNDRKIQRNLPTTNRSNEIAQRQMALLRLRNCEYTRLQKLIRSNSLEHILQPFSTIKTIENKNRQTRCLDDILHSIDSLYYPRKVTKEIDIEKNLSKLGILIF